MRERFLADPEHLPSDYENAFVNRRGEELVIAWSTAPLRDEDGEVRNIICGGLDVTERKRRELELQGERDFLDAMADSIPSLIVLTDREGQIVSDGVNQRVRATFGWTTDETTRRSFLQFVHPEDDYAARMAIAAAFNGGARRGLIALAARGPGSRGSSPGPRRRSWIRATRARRSSRARTPPSASAARAALRSSEERLRAAIEASPVAIVEYALDDTITRWNPAAERIFGWSAEEVLGGPARHQPPGARDRARRALPPRSRRRGLHGCREQADSQGRSADRRRDLRCPDPRRSRRGDQPHGAVRGHHASASARRRRCAPRARASSRRPTTRGACSSATSTTARSSGSSRSRSRCGWRRARLDDRPEAAETILDERARRARARDRGAARARARDPSGGAHRSRARAGGRRRSPAGRPFRSRSTMPAERLPGPVEAAAYYVVAEALTNVAKYAQASVARVRVSRENGRALVEVADDGVGGATQRPATRPARPRRSGRGARRDARGESPPGGGTRIRAECRWPRFRTLEMRRASPPRLAGMSELPTRHRHLPLRGRRGLDAACRTTLGDRLGRRARGPPAAPARGASAAGGHEIDCRGDELFAVFGDAGKRRRRGVAAQRALAEHSWPGGARCACGWASTPARRRSATSGYVGLDVHRAAGSARPATAARCSSRRRRARARRPVATLSDLGALRASRTSPSRSGSSSSIATPSRPSSRRSARRPEARRRRPRSCSPTTPSCCARESRGCSRTRASRSSASPAPADDLLRHVAMHKPGRRDRRHPHAADAHGRGPARGAGDPRAPSRTSACSCSRSTSSPAYALELLAESAEGVGYLLKDRVSDVDEFAAAVRRVAEGGSALDPAVVNQLVGRQRAARPARGADAARARGARADGRGPLEPGDRGAAVRHAPRASRST